MLAACLIVIVASGFLRSFDRKSVGDYYITYMCRSPKQGGEQATIAVVVPVKGKKQIEVDNRWIVLHSPEIIRNFNCHMNTEICI